MKAEWRIMHQYPMPSLVQIMACRLFGAKPLSETMLDYVLIWPPPWYLNKNTAIFIQENGFEKVVCKFCLGLIPRYVDIHQWTGSLKVEVRACCPFGPKALFEAVWIWKMIFKLPYFTHFSSHQHWRVNKTRVCVWNTGSYFQLRYVHGSGLENWSFKCSRTYKSVNRITVNIVPADATVPSRQ